MTVQTLSVSVKWMLLFPSLPSRKTTIALSPAPASTGGHPVPRTRRRRTTLDFQHLKTETSLEMKRLCKRQRTPVREISHRWDHADHGQTSPRYFVSSARKHVISTDIIRCRTAQTRTASTGLTPFTQQAVMLRCRTRHQATPPAVAAQVGFNTCNIGRG